MFWDFINAFYWDRAYEIYDNLVWHDKEKDQINIKLGGIFPKFQRYIKSVASNIENTTKSDLKRRFESHPAYLGYDKGNAWVGYKRLSSGQYLRKKRHHVTTKGEAIILEGQGQRWKTSAFTFDAKKLDSLELRTPVFPWDEDQIDPAPGGVPVPQQNGQQAADNGMKMHKPLKAPF